MGKPVKRPTDRPRRRGPREFKLTWLVERATAECFAVGVPWLGHTLYEVREVDAATVERRVRTVIKLMLLRSDGMEQYSRVRGRLIHLEWQCDEILRNRWKPHNRLRAESAKRKKS